MEKETKKVRPFGVRDQVGYVCGDMAGSFVNLFVDSYFLTFCTYVLGIIVGIGALSMVPIFCFDSDSNILPGRFTLLAVIFGVLCIACYSPLCHLTPERVHTEPGQGEKFDYGKVLKVAFKNRPLIGVMVGTIASTGAATALTAIGYVSGTNVVQSAATVNSIYYLVNIIPVLTCILELIGIGLIFNLDNNKTNTMYAELKERRDATKSAE